MRYIFLLLLILLNAQAQECANVNYLTQRNSPFNRIPVQDQDGVGICYAYTAAQLVDYHLIRSGQTTSPVMHPAWLALKSSRRILEQGTEWEAITMLRSAGSCNQDQVDAALNAFSGDSNLRGSYLVAFIETYAREMQRLTSRGTIEPTRAMVEAAYIKAGDGVAWVCPDQVLWDRLLPSLTPLNETSVQMFSRLLGQTCTPENIHRYNIPQPLIAQMSNNDQAKASLDDQVSKGPFTMAYCSHTWDDANYNMNRAAPGDICGMHSSLVVGRKKIGPHCYMLVRNSWGTGWGAWNQNESCLCKNKQTGAWVDNCREATHNDGNHTVEACYIGLNRLSHNVQDITTFNP